MKVGKQSRRDGKAIFNACCVNGVLDEAKVRQAVAAVIAQTPLAVRWPELFAARAPADALA